MTILQKSYKFELSYFLDNPTDILQFLIIFHRVTSTPTLFGDFYSGDDFKPCNFTILYN